MTDTEIADDRPPERIVSVACRFQGLIYVLPGKHLADLLGAMRRNRIPVELHGSIPNRGFLTDRGRFLTQTEALPVAVAAGQVEEARLKSKPPLLHAEDITKLKAW